MTSTEPLWWTSRKSDTVSRQFVALAAARTPEVQQVVNIRPLAPVIALNAVRLAKGLKGIRITLREEA